jgi:hypothetical protein
VTEAQLYKVLDKGGQPFHGGTGKWTKGRWRSVEGDLVACRNGLHACTIAQLPEWLGPEVWLFEADGEVIDAGDKMVARKARITERIETWNERTARLFAADCAEHVLPLFERHYPNDDRPRKAVEASRAFARGEIDRTALAAARDAARAAAWDAARAAARDAARAAARDAARAAAWAAAWDAAWDAARAAARDAEIKWQADRLAMYLSGELK